jgi:predicted ATPase
MLKQLILENWKSFRYAELNFDPLTVLIGANASGKSNAIEALEFLRRIFLGKTVQEALLGDSVLSPIRGGSEWATHQGNNQFTLKVLIRGQDEVVDYLYSVTAQTTTQIGFISESLKEIKRQGTNKSYESELFAVLSPVQNKDSKLYDTSRLFLADEANSTLQGLGETLGNVQRAVNEFGNPLDESSDSLLNNADVLIQQFKPYSSLLKSSSELVQAVKNIFVMNPLPSKMRSYSPLSNELLNDASNIAGVLAALPNQKKAEIEATLVEYVAHLPERDIQRVWAETVGRLNSDAMLYCEEAWVTGEEPMLIDARGMSDGTLRFLAILTALLTRPEGSQLVVEDVDDGLHPSRIQLLLKMLREIGAKRNIDILITTHNPALLNALDPEMIPFITVAYRDSQTGESKLALLEELESLPQVLALGPLGNAATKGVIEKNLAAQK